MPSEEFLRRYAKELNKKVVKRWISHFYGGHSLQQVPKWVCLANGSQICFKPTGDSRYKYRSVYSSHSITDTQCDQFLEDAHVATEKERSMVEFVIVDALWGRS